MGSKWMNGAYAIYRWIQPVFDPVHTATGLAGYAWYARDWLRYRRAPGAERLSLRDAFPKLHDKTSLSPYDSHYFHQDVWAIRRIFRTAKGGRHVDVGSRVDTVGHLAAVMDVTFVDIRPLVANLEGMMPVGGSILSLPFRDGSVPSLSCLHVAEHIGLGRYGDPIDPAGTRKAAAELARVLAPGGNLFFSLPVGRPRVCFNAHRVHAPRQILEYFRGLELVELSGVMEPTRAGPGAFVRDAPIEALEDQSYACGLFWFRKPDDAPLGAQG